MKIGVRITELKGEIYNRLFLQLLDISEGTSSVSVLGNIQFQSNQSEPDYWYGRQFSFDGDKLSRLEEFTKAIKRIKDVYDPSGIIEGLKAERLFTSNGWWYTESEAGCNVYKVLRYNTLSEEHEHWSNVNAPDYLTAVKIMSRKYKKDSDRFSIDPYPIHKLPTL